MTILIVDDDPVQCRLLEGMLHKFEYETLTRDSGDGGVVAARRARRRADRLRDPRSGDAESRRSRRVGQDAPVRDQCAGDRADRAWRHRQCRFRDARRARSISWSSRSAPNACMSACATRSTPARSKASLQRLKNSRSGTLGFKDIITKSAAMHAVLRMAEKAAASTIPVLISRRIRRRQGIDRARDPRLRRAPGQAVHRGELRRDAGEPRRVRSCSATRKARSPAPPSAMSANSSRPRAALCSSTRSANCRPPPKSSFCARSRKAKSSRSARASR